MWTFFIIDLCYFNRNKITPKEERRNFPLEYRVQLWKTTNPWLQSVGWTGWVGGEVKMNRWQLPSRINNCWSCVGGPSWAALAKRFAFITSIHPPITLWSNIIQGSYFGFEGTLKFMINTIGNLLSPKRAMSGGSGVGFPDMLVRQ